MHRRESASQAYLAHFMPCQPQTAPTSCCMPHCNAELLKSMLEMASFLGNNKVLRTDGTEVSITLMAVSYIRLLCGQAAMSLPPV